MSRGAPGADYPNLLFIHLVGIDVNDDHEHDCPNHADGVPALLIIDHPVGNDDMQRIVPDLARKLERNAVLGEIAGGFP
jgi:hypothetical protein